MIFKFLNEVTPPVSLGTDPEEISDKLFKLDMDTIDISDNMANIELHEECAIIKDSGLPYRLSKTAFNQWLQRARIPLSYAYDLTFDMLLYNISRRSKQYNKRLRCRIRKHDSDIIKIGGKNDMVRAMLTSKYNVVQNSTCFVRFKDVMKWSAMNISKCMVSEDFFQIIATGEEAIDDDIATGVELINGETGMCSLELNTILKTPTTYLIISDTRRSTKFNMKESHLKKGIRDQMAKHSKEIVENFSTFKNYIKVAKETAVLTREIISTKEKLDVAIGRVEARKIAEDMQNKTKYESAMLLAELGDDLTDIEKQRLMKMAAGRLIIS